MVFAKTMERKLKSALAREKILDDALARLLFLHSCEQEGIASGMPTPDQWIDAVGAAAAARIIVKAMREGK